MKHLLLAGLLLGAVSCRHDDDALQYEKVRVERYEPSVRIEPEGELQYMAFCSDEGRALSGWTDSRSEAQSKAGEYHGEHPDRECTVLWRQKPGRMTFKSE
ncbi:MAG TPA: hypothetical protein VE981_02790 [Planctomycetota bacterium]|nr:hypothetical protein [Planctomycetota bacterium]